MRINHTVLSLTNHSNSRLGILRGRQADKRWKQLAASNSLTSVGRRAGWRWPGWAMRRLEQVTETNRHRNRDTTLLSENPQADGINPSCLPEYVLIFEVLVFSSNLVLKWDEIRLIKRRPTCRLYSQIPESDSVYNLYRSFPPDHLIAVCALACQGGRSRGFPFFRNFRDRLLASAIELSFCNHKPFFKLFLLFYTPKLNTFWSIIITQRSLHIFHH